MLKLKFKNGQNNSDYLYRCSIELVGRSVELGISYKTLSSLRERSQQLLSEFKKWRIRVTQREKKAEVKEEAASTKKAMKQSEGKEKLAAAPN